MSPVDDDGGVGSLSKPISTRKRSAITGDAVSVRRVPKSRQCKKAASSSSDTGQCKKAASSTSNTGGRAPRVQLSLCPGPLHESMSRQFAKVALSDFNKKSRATEYELVKALECIEFPRFGLIFHSNFIARPKNGSECEDKLFFAEVKGEVKVTAKGDRVDFTCLFCCILEPCDLEARVLTGCRSCDRFPGRVQHPEHYGS